MIRDYTARSISKLTTFWLEHNGGINYDTSHLIESIKRRNLNKPSDF